MIKRSFNILKNPAAVLNYFRKYVRLFFERFLYCINRDYFVNRYAMLRLNNYKQHKICAFLSKSSEELYKLYLNDKVAYSALVSQADLILDDNLLILNKNRKLERNKENSKIEWLLDWDAHLKFTPCFYADAIKQNGTNGRDIKTVWEQARLQSLFCLGLAYRVTSDEKYAKKCIELILSFLENNAFEEGPNWYSSMETGIRLANIILGCELIQDAPCFTKSIYNEILYITYLHRIHIQRNLENTSGKTGNHYIANLLGLSAAVTAFPDLPGTEKCREFVSNELHKELLKQILNDGGHYEHSTSYHRLTSELFAFTIILLGKSGFSLTDDEKIKIEKASNFIISLMTQSGLVPQIGDNDSGRVFQLMPEETRNHTSCLNLLLNLIEKKYDISLGVKDGFCCFYPNDINTCIQLTSNIRDGFKQYDDFGVYIWNNKEIYLLFSAITPTEKEMKGHVHNDSLSFFLSVKGKEFIVDPGSYEYGGSPIWRNKFRSDEYHSVVKCNGIPQRLYSEDLFCWNSLSSSQIVVDKNTITGKLFINHARICQSRKISIKNPFEICIEDSFSKDVCSCQIMLPLSPQVKVKQYSNTVYLTNGECRLKITGTWNFSIVDGFYSQQYKEKCKTFFVCGNSNLSSNRLQILIDQ